MSEDVARAVGARAPQAININGKDCYPRGLGLRELGEIERDCLEQYRRSYVKTFADNADLLGPIEGPKLIREKLEEAAAWDVSNLPKKHAYDPKRIDLNPKVLEWIAANVDNLTEDPTATEEQKQTTLRRVVAVNLDAGNLTPAEYKAMTGKEPFGLKVGYVNWWVTGTPAGMVAMISKAFATDGISKDDILNAIGKNPRLLIDISREIEHLSVPAAGNG